jgi:hypothetical protein
MKSLSVLIALLGCLQFVGTTRAQTATQPPTAPLSSTGTVRGSGDNAGPRPAKVQPHAVVLDQTDKPDSSEPIRTRRRFIIAGELGWNSLAGMGVNATYHPIPLLALELGAGLSAVGIKGGVRVRVNLLQSLWTPTLGVGFMYGSGLGGEEIKTAEDDDGKTAKYRVLGSPYLQLVGGVNYTSSRGIVLMTTVGWAFLLRGHNVKYVEGPTKLVEDAEPFFGGGLVLASSLGYAF